MLGLKIDIRLAITSYCLSVRASGKQVDFHFRMEKIEMSSPLARNPLDQLATHFVLWALLIKYEPSVLNLIFQSNYFPLSRYNICLSFAVSYQAADFTAVPPWVEIYLYCEITYNYSDHKNFSQFQCNITAILRQLSGSF